MLVEPEFKRAVVFFDGQNLFHHARDAFGYEYPNYCPFRLASRVCLDMGFNLQEIRFYTGIPDAQKNPFWHHFWSAKLLAMSRLGVRTFSRSLRYRKKAIRLKDGIDFSTEVSEEKGIDVRIAIDVMRMARKNLLDVALIFSQDQDFSEVADEVRTVSQEQGRWIKMASAYPVSSTASNRRGINKTDWIKIDRALYDACIDQIGRAHV